MSTANISLPSSVSDGRISGGVFAGYVQAHQVGGACGSARLTGDDDQAVARSDHALVAQLGIDYFEHAVGVLIELQKARLNAPIQAELAEYAFTESHGDYRSGGTTFG